MSAKKKTAKSPNVKSAAKNSSTKTVAKKVAKGAAVNGGEKKAPGRKKEPEPGTWEAIVKSVEFAERVGLTWP